MTFEHLIKLRASKLIQAGATQPKMATELFTVLPTLTTKQNVFLMGA
jgi:hypothetical protein